MADNFIQLEKSDVLTLKIRTADGKETGESLEFDFEDTGIYLTYQNMIEKIEKDKKWLNNQYLIIGKRQDVKGKKLLSKNEEDTFRAEQEFFKRIAEDYNMFLGENGVQKLLNGKKLGWITIDRIDRIIKKQIEPQLEKYQDLILDKIKNKYVQNNKQSQEIEVIK